MNSISHRKTILALAIANCLAAPAHAASITVTSKSDDDGAGCTLREAVTSFNPPGVVQSGCTKTGVDGVNDTVIFDLGAAPQTIVLNGNPIDILSDLTIDGADRDQIIVDGDASSRLFYTSTPNVSLSNLTMQNGSTTVLGGAVGIYSPSSGDVATVTISNSTIRNCTTTGDGGAVSNDYGGGSLVISNSTITGNSAARAGAISVGARFAFVRPRKNAKLFISDSQIHNNTGGGIVVRSSDTVDTNLQSSVYIADTDISANTFSGSSGGAVYGGGSPQVTIVRSTLNDNTATAGGAIDITGAAEVELSVVNTTVSGNQATASNGGGIRTNGIPVSIQNSTIRSNTSSRDGGGISESGGSLYIKNTRVYGNSATASNRQGGGISTFPSTSSTIVGSSIHDNYSPGAGGGISVFSGDINIRQTTVSGNRSNNIGGGIRVRDSITIIEDSTISGNSAPGRGGGVYTSYIDQLDIRNSTFSGNQSGYRGGGLFITGFGSDAGFDDIKLFNNTITNNTAATSGGGLLTSADTSLYNNLISGNTSPAGADINVDQVSASTVSSFNLIGSSELDTDDSIKYFTPDATDILVTSNSLLPTPLASVIGALKNNGGPTHTHALIEESPAINAASTVNCGEATSITKDQRGRTRSDERCDIGAYELLSETSFFIIPAANGKTVIVDF